MLKSHQSFWAGPFFSPDGHWLAYQSDETGRNEVFVQPFPANGTKYQVSKEADNHHPLPDGKELFYVLGPNQFVGVAISTRPSFSFGDPVPLFPPGNQGSPWASVRNSDITPDGKQFIGVIAAGETVPVTPQIQVVLNWFSELQQRVPVR